MDRGALAGLMLGIFRPSSSLSSTATDAVPTADIETLSKAASRPLLRSACVDLVGFILLDVGITNHAVALIALIALVTAGVGLAVRLMMVARR